MILRFALENWMSFRDTASFSMLATRERQHSARVPKVAKYGAKILPVAAIYGGNASGKTNFFKALSFAKGFIVGGAPPDGLIPVEPHRLDPRAAERPSCFTLEILIGEIVYELYFSVTRRAVLEERLTEIGSGVRDKVLYERRAGDIVFHTSLRRDAALTFAFKGTGDNQLFLTNAVSQKIEVFRPVYEWFRNQLRLIAPDARFGGKDPFLDETHPQNMVMNDALARLDTGIVRLGGEEIPLEGIHPTISEWLKANWSLGVKEGSTVRVPGVPGRGRITLTRKDGRLVARRVVAHHRRADGEEASFNIEEESDGSQRVIELLPAFLDLAAPSARRVYVVDEIDRSLHTLLTQELLEGYLATCSAISRSQLLFTTHDVLLMDQHFFRRDEMWVTERDAEGGSRLFSFSDFKDVRHDKDIRKSYLQGRLGGIPRILLKGAPGARRARDK
ncbi:MAG: AAA family ATPase, partial [Acidiferrobacter sp.]